MVFQKQCDYAAAPPSAAPAAGPPGWPAAAAACALHYGKNEVKR